VAVGTDIATTDMVGGLTGRYNAVVTTLAATDDIGMVDCGRWRPCGIPMAVFTDIGGTDMGAVLTRRRRTVMTGRALTCHIGMIEVGRHPGIGCVAICTYIGTGNVIRRPASRDPSVVTAEASSLHIGMINLNHGLPSSNLMAAFADIGGLDMLSSLAGGR